MATLFVFSDCHGFFNELKEALDNAGFDSNNKGHFVIGLGDYCDRGRQPQETINYLESLDRCILVRGNHTSLLKDCIERGFPYSHDWHNGTAQTIIDLAPNAKTFQDACNVAYNKVELFANKMVDYFETKNFIFTHGWIPLICNDNLPIHYNRNRKFEFNPDWRNAHNSEWEQARWLNGMDMAQKGFIEPGKTIVCGHWHCSYGHMLDSIKTDNWISEFEEDAIWEPYYGDGVIAIDACTVHTGKVNVLVLEDEFMEDNHDNN